MSTNARWIIGLLLALVIGLAVGLAIVASDDSDSDGGETVTLPAVTESTPETTTQSTETQPPPAEGSGDTGGIAAP